MTYTQIIGGQPLSIVDALTATNIELGTVQARGLIIPVSALVAGGTLTFYLKSDTGYNRQIYNTILDARAVLQGTFLGGYTEQGPLVGRQNGKFYVNGADVTFYDSAVVFGSLPAGRYHQFVVRFDAIPCQEGFMYFYMDDTGSGPLQPLHFADVRWYHYVLTPAQIAQPLLPNDPAMRLTFADYQTGDTRATDMSGHGNDAVIFY